MPDQILLEGIEFYGYHGVPDEEQAIGHRYRVDVVLELDLSQAGRTDQLEHTVNYAEVAQRIVAIGTGTRYRLMEALAERLCREILETFPPVQRVELTLRKRLPPAGTVMENAGVRIARER
ncbi:MAG: dihydroneopterin aldolase [Armatimonadetes bacterium]|nr:dihydroneopterin aldolase [Armatimonadota bacterium]CUU38290.1 dihydroneopterin aldolase [Armatimonadetes bacterium DC]